MVPAAHPEPGQYRAVGGAPDPVQVGDQLRWDGEVPARDPGGGHRIDEPAGGGSDPPQPLIRGRRGHQADQGDPLFPQTHLEVGALLQRQVGDDHPRGLSLRQLRCQPFEPKGEKRVVVTHQQVGCGQPGSQLPQLIESGCQADSVDQSLMTGVLNRLAIGHRIAEWDADLHQIGGVGDFQ